MEKNIDDLNIYEGVLKNIMIGLASLMMLLIAVVIINVAWEFEGFKKIGMILIGAFGIIFFAMGAVFCFKQVFIRKPVIVLSTEGFMNCKQSYSKKMPFLSWDKVSTIEVRDLLSESFLCIDLNNEDEYLESMSKSMRVGAKANQKMGYSVISISANSLKGYNIETLYDEFEFYHDIYLNSKKKSK
ncbi:MAG: STM3941 family protein [Erysipelothrix sp.]